MKRYDRLILVSNSDTAAGPMACAILEKKLMLEDLLVISKGIVVLVPEPVNPKVEAILVSNGLTMKKHMSDPLLQEDLDDARTLVLAVSEATKQKIMKEYKTGDETQLFSLKEYIQDSEEPEVPYGGTLANYGQYYEELELLLEKLSMQLKKEELS